MQWHPDKWTRTPSLLGEAKQKFQQIQKAYSDQRKKTLYDAGLYDPDDEEVIRTFLYFLSHNLTGFSDFVQEMVTIMDQARREEKSYSLEELQSMLLEMAQGFESPTWFCGPSILEDPGCSMRTRCDMNSVSHRGSHLQTTGLGMFGKSGYCN
ncbi:hypothetical protein RGQ29_002188 [Quercus rubra]|uniref:J domain-containing protein n=1 Tax=Quercus rubra TaxID=3512 RepID=A0AAN7GF34_QUERU|nr:hypothetical protein RGQ29_002188 [Quercus rubra]